MAVHPLHDLEDYVKWIDIILNLALLLPILSFALLQCGPRKPREQERAAPVIASAIRSAEAMSDGKPVGADKSSANKHSRKNLSKVDEEEKLPSYLKSNRTKLDPLTAYAPKTEKRKQEQKRDWKRDGMITHNESAKTDYTTPPWLRWRKLPTRSETAADADYFKPISVPAATAPNASKLRELSTRTVLPAPAAAERTARLEVDVERTQGLPPTMAMGYYGGGSRYSRGKTKSVEECSSTVVSHCCQSSATVPSVSPISPHSCASSATKNSPKKSTKRRPSSSSSERSNTTSKHSSHKATGS